MSTPHLRNLTTLLCLLLISFADAAEPRVPIIYSTDLYHPPTDPDDHFDTAVDSIAKVFHRPVTDTDYRSVMESVLTNLTSELGRKP